MLLTLLLAMLSLLLYIIMTHHHHHHFLHINHQAAESKLMSVKAEAESASQEREAVGGQMQAQQQVIAGMYVKGGCVCMMMGVVTMKECV